MHIVFYRRKKSFIIIEMKLRHCITLQKNTEKTILLYIIVCLLLVAEHISHRSKHEAQICQQCRKHTEEPHV